MSFGATESGQNSSVKKSDTTYRNIWKAMIVNALKGNGTQKQKYAALPDYVIGAQVHKKMFYEESRPKTLLVPLHVSNNIPEHVEPLSGK